VHGERAPARDAHQRARKRREAAQAEHDVGLAAPNHRPRLDARGDQRERPEQERRESLATHAAERQRLERHAVPRHQRRLEALAGAEPEHARTAGGERVRDGEPGKHVSAGSARGDHHRRRHAT